MKITNNIHIKSVVKNDLTIYKKLIVVLLVLLSVSACKKETHIDYTIISGKITNKTSDVIIIKDENNVVKDSISVLEDGSFIDTLKLKTGEHKLFYNRETTPTPIPIYIDSTGIIDINFDVHNFKNTLSFSGTNPEINRYLFARQQKENEIRGDTILFHIQLDGVTYKNKEYQIKKSLDSLLLASEGIPEAYKTTQKEYLHCGYLYRLSTHQKFHRMFTGNFTYKASDTFLAELKVVYDNPENEFLNIDIKSILLDNYCKIIAEKIAERDTISKEIAYLKAVDNVANKPLRDDLLFKSAQVKITIAKDEEAYYNAFMSISTNVNHKNEITAVYEQLKKTVKGQPSPQFINYENHAGGTTSLTDFKGKYVYVDVWATWCGPCIGEVPALQKVEKEYHDKNIAFVSISIDKKSAYDKWRNMVIEKEFSGIQLIADSDWNSSFIKDYSIKFIPRFILIDSQGNIVDADAPRPSEEKLKELFDGLN